MGQAENLPVWLNAVWMTCSFLTFMGGAVWLVVIFWPALRLQIKLLQENTRLNHESRESFERLPETVADAVAEGIRKGLKGLKDSDKLEGRFRDLVAEAVDEALGEAMDGGADAEAETPDGELERGRAEK